MWSSVPVTVRRTFGSASASAFASPAGKYTSVGGTTSSTGAVIWRPSRSGERRPSRARAGSGSDAVEVPEALRVVVAEEPEHCLRLGGEVVVRNRKGGNRVDALPVGAIERGNEDRALVTVDRRDERARDDLPVELGHLVAT